MTRNRGSRRHVCLWRYEIGWGYHSSVTFFLKGFQKLIFEGFQNFNFEGECGFCFRIYEKVIFIKTYYYIKW
jgi:hypothetical protein